MRRWIAFLVVALAAVESSGAWEEHLSYGVIDRGEPAAAGSHAGGNGSRLRRATTGRLTQAQRIEFLTAHNAVRQTVVPPASDMLKMVWNAELESMAQEWANGCDFKHGQPSRTTTPFSPIGQNLWAGSGTYSPTGATNSWFDEKQFYSYDTVTCQSGKVCGHYTQVAWAKSYAIGCGISLCASVAGIANAHYVVCNYGPAGNYVGSKPFQTGSACSACPDTKNTCDSGLCRAEPFCSTVTECKPTDTTNCLCDESYYLGTNPGSGGPAMRLGLRLSAAGVIGVAAVAIFIPCLL